MGSDAIHNLAALGAHPIPIGIVGDDPEGQRLLQFFAELGIDISSIVVAKSYRTPSKTRILAGAVHSQRQQIVRLDAGAPLTDEKARDAAELKFKAAMKHGHALLVAAGDITTGAEMTYSIKGTSPHTHNVTITAAQFTTLQGGGSVQVTSDLGDSAHTHIVTITCA